MEITGVGYRSAAHYYPHINSKTGKKAESQNVQPGNQCSGGITLNWSDGAIFASGTPDGQSFSIYKADGYSADNPILNIKGIDKDGNSYEQQINPLTVDPENASYVEMMAVNAYLVDIGELDVDDFTAFERPTDDDLEKADYLKALREWRDTQYSVGNMVGYHKAANVCNALVNLQHEQDGTVKVLEGTDGAIRVKQVEGRLQSGIIGMSSFGSGDNFHLLEARYADDSTAENPIIEVRISNEFGEPTVYKVNINDVDPENATQLEMFALCSHAEAQGISTSDRNYMSLMEYASASGYDADDITDFVEKKRDWVKIANETLAITDKDAGLFAYNIGLPPREQTLTDQKYTDDETGISWYVGKDGIPYMLEEDAEKLIRLCKDTGENWLKKAAEMTGLASADNTDESLSMEERAFQSIAPNAPEEVKQTWMKAVEQTGVNGVGLEENGMMSHITQLDVQRAIKWYHGKDTDVLGETVESARQAVEKALYDLEHPLEPLANRSAGVQKQIEKEKQFYEKFLENLN